MSRIGQNPIKIPEEVKTSFEGNTIKINGPKGSLEFTFHKYINIKEMAVSIDQCMERLAKS